jgi:hypothetical protein
VGNLFEQLPLLARLHLAGGESRHVEEIGDHAAQAGRLLADGDRGFVRPLGQRRLLHRQRIREPDDGRQRRAHIVREGGEYRVAQALGRHLHLRMVGHLDVVEAFDGDRHQRRGRG